MSSLRNMRSAKFFFILLLLIIPLASAVTYYSPNKQLSITETCGAANDPVALRLLVDGQSIWFGQMTTDQNKNFTFQYTPPATGNYTLNIGCTGVNKDYTFCVGTATTCKPTTTKKEDTKIQEDKKDADDKKAPPTTSGGTGGGKKKCSPQWSCSTWSLCNASLQQSRTCTDLKLCRKAITETKKCSACLESWVCTHWDTCSLGYQDRKCYDEHKCGTYLIKPTLQKVCQAKDTGYTPAKFTYQIPTSVTTAPSYTITPVKKVTKSFWKQLWDNYAVWILAVPSALLVLTILLLLFLHFYKPKTEVENIDELKQWVTAELKRGTSKEKIKALITHHTGWTEEELHEAFEELKHEHAPVQQPKTPPAGKPTQQPVARVAPKPPAQPTPTTTAQPKPPQ